MDPFNPSSQTAAPTDLTAAETLREAMVSALRTVDADEVPSHPPLIKFRGKSANLSRGLYVTAQDQVQIVCETSLAGGDIVNAVGRMILPGGVEACMNWTVRPAQNSFVNVFFPLQEGWLTSVCVVNNVAGGNQRGTFISVVLIYGAATQPVVTEVLCSGYCNPIVGPTWPSSPIERATQGLGNYRSITGTAHTGTNLSETPGARRFWRLYSFRFSLTTSAVAGTRAISLVIKDGSGNTVWQQWAQATQAPSLTQSYQFGCSLGFEETTLNNGQVTTGLPPFYLPFGYTIGTIVTALDAGDAFTAPQYVVEEWIVRNQ